MEQKETKFRIKIQGNWHYFPWDFNEASAAMLSFVTIEEEKTKGEFIGMQSQNGIDIYEGDILNKGGDNLLLVRWNPDILGFETVIYSDGVECERYFLTKGQEDILIIGNIHDNPELLKQ